MGDISFTAGDPAGSDPGAVIAAPRLVPLSIGQERLYRLARLNPDEPLYNIAAAYRLTGDLDLALLAEAVNEIAARHEPLRATFGQADGGPICMIAPAGDPATFLFSDLSGLPAPEREVVVEDLLAAEAAQTFDLETGPLWRVRVAGIGEGEHVLMLTMHHIVTDGWSFALFFKELGALYAALRAGRAPEVAALKIGYAEFGARQRDLVASPACAKQRDYWTDRFARPPEPLRLPGGTAGQFIADRTCATVPLAVPEETGRALMDFSQQEQSTLFMSLLAAFTAVLGRISGQEDILLCTPVTGRHYAQTRHLIGYFNNILPLRFDLGGKPSFRDVMTRVRETALAAYKNQDVPFQTVSALPGMRAISPSRVLFSLDMPWPPDFALEGLACTPLVLDTGTADFDLGVSMWVRDNRIYGTLRYKTALFEAGTMDALAAAYLAAIRTLSAHPDRRISTLAADRALVAACKAGAGASGEGAVREDILPRDATELKVARHWEAVFGPEPIGIRDDLASLGASSLAVADLAERIQRSFGVDISLGTIFRANTIEKMADSLKAQAAPASRSPLAPIRPEGTGLPIFLCEGVGIYYALAAALDPAVPVYALFSEFGADYPGVKELAARYLAAVKEVQPEGPYRLGGLSFGGLVAFEMAQQLVARGESVSLLALFDTPGPGAYRLKSRLGRAIGHTRNFFRYGPSYAASRFVPRLKRMSRRSSPSQASAPDARALEENAIRALFQGKADSYRIDPYPGRITLFMLDERDAASDSLFDPALGDIDPYLGWDKVACGGVERHLLDGEHVTILKQPHVTQLAMLLNEALRSGQAGQPSEEPARAD